MNLGGHEYHIVGSISVMLRITYKQEGKHFAHIREPPSERSIRTPTLQTCLLLEG